MKRKPSQILILFITVLVLSLLSASARILLTKNCLDANYGVYRSGEVLPTIYHILLFIICAAFVAAAFLTVKKNDTQIRPAVGEITIFASCISAFMLAASSLLSLYYIIICGQSASIYDWLMIACSIPAIIFFLVNIKAKLNSPAAQTFMSFFPIAWCAVYLIRVYFDTSLLMTNPHKTLHQLALLAAMVYFLNESRFLLGRVNSRLFIASSAIAPILLLSTALPALFLPKQLLIGSSDSYIDYAVECTFAIFILTRLYCAGYADMPAVDNTAVNAKTEAADAQNK